MEVNNEILEIVCFEKRTFEGMAVKLDYFVPRMDDFRRLPIFGEELLTVKELHVCLK